MTHGVVARGIILLVVSTRPFRRPNTLVGVGLGGCFDRKKADNPATVAQTHDWFDIMEFAMTDKQGNANMRSSLASLEPKKSGAKYTVRTRCPQCGREHITVFRLRHVSDSFFVQLGHFFLYARHFDFQRLRWCTNSGQHPKWSAS